MATEHIELCQLRNTWFPRIARRARYCVCMPSSCATWSSLSKRSFSFRNNFQFPTPKSSETKTRNKDLDSNLNKVPTAPPLISHVSILATCCIMPWARKRLEQLQIAFCLLKVPPFRVPFGRCRMAKHWSSTTLEFAKQKLLGPIAKVLHHQLCWESES